MSAIGARIILAIYTDKKGMPAIAPFPTEEGLRLALGIRNNHRDKKNTRYPWLGNHHHCHQLD